MYSTVSKHCKNFNCKNSAYPLITARIRNVEKLANKLKVLLYNRHKRGLINGIGSLSKLLFGTLDENDLTLINENIDKLFEDQNKLTHIIQNQTIIFKEILHDSHFTELTEQLSNHSQQLNQAITGEILDQNLLMLEILITELASKISDFYYMIILGKKGIIDTTLIDIRNFIESYNKLIDKNFIVMNRNMKFQEIIDISRLNTATKNNALVYQIVIPALEENKWKVLHYVAIPYKIQNNFIAPVLENEYTLQEKTNYIPIDYEYLSRHCRNSPIGKLCKRVQPMIHFDKQNFDPINKCKTAIFKIDTITFIPLQNFNKYIVVPQKPIVVQAICDTIVQINIHQPSILSSTIDCVITYNNSLMKIGGTTKEINIEISNYSLSNPFQDHDLNLLKDLLPTTEQVTPNFKSYERPLNVLNNQLNNLRNQRRILTTTETIINIFKYLGYISIGIITVYLLYKIGIFRHLPKTICIKLFCNETTIRNNTEPRINYAPKTETLYNERPIEDNRLYQIEDSKGTPTGPTKVVRFGTKRSLRRGV